MKGASTSKKERHGVADTKTTYSIITIISLEMDAVNVITQVFELIRPQVCRYLNVHTTESKPTGLV